MIIFMYTHTYHDGLQEKSDGTPRVEPGSQKEGSQARLDTHPGLQTDSQAESVPDSEEESTEATKTEILKPLLSHIKMKAIAEYYDIPELRHCANARIQNCLGASWSSHSFPIVVREAFDSTGDKELHNHYSRGTSTVSARTRWGQLTVIWRRPRGAGGASRGSRQRAEPVDGVAKAPTTVTLWT